MVTRNLAESNLLGLTSGLRQPSYSTDNMAMVDGINGAAIVQVAAFNAGGGDGSRASGGDDEKMSFQVASLDNRGNLVFWVVVELSVNELYVARRAAAVLVLWRRAALTLWLGWRSCSGVSEVDLGLGIGARIKLVKSASVDVGPGPVNKALTFDTAMMGDYGPCVTDFALCPNDVGRCLVSTTLGSVLHKSRFGEAPPPRTFAPPTSALSAATAVAVSPWNPKYFLVGYGNGVVWCVGDALVGVVYVV